MVANTLPAYFFGLAIGQLVYGPLSDRIGRKKPLYFGLALYAVASLFCVMATNEWSLIAARILQALGGCVGVVMARAAIRDKLDVQGSAQAFSSMMIVMGLAPILAPYDRSMDFNLVSVAGYFYCAFNCGCAVLAVRTFLF